jgi:Putative adhesin
MVPWTRGVFEQVGALVLARRGRAMTIRHGVGGVLARTILTLLFAGTIAAQEQKLTYTVGPKAVISITNGCGPITVRAAGKGKVVVTTVSRSEAVSLVNEQRGNRIQIKATPIRQGRNLVEYTVLVPRDALVILRSVDGTLQAQGLTGDLIMEASSGAVGVTGLVNAHIRVRTLSGPINLTDIREGHLNVLSVSGNVKLQSVVGSSVAVHSESGWISYEGDPGTTGEYVLTLLSG